jgi:hypothetical protein
MGVKFQIFQIEKENELNFAILKNANKKKKVYFHFVFYCYFKIKK